MNDQQIYQFLARKPDSRAQDIADAMDVDLKVASDALRSLVDVGDVVRHSGTAPNGLQAQLYHLSDEFKKGRDFGAICSMGPRPAASPEVLTPAPTKPAFASTPVFVSQTELPRSLTKVEQAIEYLTRNPGATDDQMRIAMGLQRTSSPASYLASAVRAGRVEKTVDGWMLGNGTPTIKARAPAIAKPAATDVKNVVVIGNTILASKDHKEIAPQVVAAVSEVSRADVTDLPPAVVEQLSKPAQALAAEAAARSVGPVFRCGLWSDGVLELQRNGESVASLTRGEGEQLAAFMNRMLGQVEQAA